MAILTFMLGSSVDYDVSLPPVSVLLALALRLLIHAHTALVFDVDAVGAADFALLRESESQLSMSEHPRRLKTASATVKSGGLGSVHVISPIRQKESSVYVLLI